MKEPPSTTVDIAEQLCLSPEAFEMHRARGMQKVHERLAERDAFYEQLESEMHRAPALYHAPLSSRARSQRVRTTPPRARSREMSHAPRTTARRTPKAAARSGDSDSSDPPGPGDAGHPRRAVVVDDHYLVVAVAPVHPAADVFPMIADDELGALAEDIRANGLQAPIVLWQDNADTHLKSPAPYYLLDGRNRLAAKQGISKRTVEDARARARGKPKAPRKAKLALVPDPTPRVEPLRAAATPLPTLTREQQLEARIERASREIERFSREIHNLGEARKHWSQELHEAKALLKKHRAKQGEVVA